MQLSRLQQVHRRGKTACVCAELWRSARTNGLDRRPTTPSSGSQGMWFVRPCSRCSRSSVPLQSGDSCSSQRKLVIAPRRIGQRVAKLERVQEIEVSGLLKRGMCGRDDQPRQNQVSPFSQPCYLPRADLSVDRIETRLTCCLRRGIRPQYQRYFRLLPLEILNSRTQPRPRT